MRGGGLPCRSAGCDMRFVVTQGDSLPALLEAGARRNEHEISAHDYRHVTLSEQTRVPFQRPVSYKERRSRI